MLKKFRGLHEFVGAHRKIFYQGQHLLLFALFTLKMPWLWGYLLAMVCIWKKNKSSLGCLCCFWQNDCGMAIKWQGGCFLAVSQHVLKLA